MLCAHVCVCVPLHTVKFPCVFVSFCLYAYLGAVSVLVRACVPCMCVCMGVQYVCATHLSALTDYQKGSECCQRLKVTRRTFQLFCVICEELDSCQSPSGVQWNSNSAGGKKKGKKKTEKGEKSPMLSAQKLRSLGLTAARRYLYFLCWK